MIRQVKQIGSEILKEISAAVIGNNDYIQKVVQDMIDTMRDTSGVGIAAPQIGIPLRIVVVEVDKNKRYPDRSEYPLTVMINPEYEVTEDEKECDYEGCLSVPGIRGLIGRYKKIRVQYLDENMVKKTTILEDFIARVVQHEIDHLDGINFLNKVLDNNDLISNDYYFSDILPIKNLKAKKEVLLKSISKSLFVKILDIDSTRLKVKLSKRIKEEDVIKILNFFEFKKIDECIYEKDKIRVAYKSNSLQINKG